MLVRPELVVEIALDGVQASTRYPGGVALRFARVKRYRPDKDAAEADTIDDSARAPAGPLIAAGHASGHGRRTGRYSPGQSAYASSGSSVSFATDAPCFAATSLTG